MSDKIRFILGEEDIPRFGTTSMPIDLCRLHLC